MDVAELIGRYPSIPVTVLIIATLMTNEAADHAHKEDPREAFYDGWREIMGQASELFVTSTNPAGRR